jgi:hypothetical protein
VGLGTAMQAALLIQEALRSESDSMTSLSWHSLPLCDQVLSGPSLMTSYDVTPIRWFLGQLSPHSMRVFWSSRRHKVSHDCCCCCLS